MCNVLTGPSGPMGAELTGNPLVRKLSFTGSTEVGAKLLAQCAATIKKTSMELGGNAPFIVFDDADLDAAVVGAMASKYRNTGWTDLRLRQPGCWWQDESIRCVRGEIENRCRGDESRQRHDRRHQPGTADPTPDALAKVEEHIDDAVKRGASIVTGGHRHALGGNFFQPTILANVPPDALIFREETFGPVAPLFRLQDRSRGDQRWPMTPISGLASYFYARDMGPHLPRSPRRLEYGIKVGINEGIISTAEAPFGGVKQSGLGREGSKYGIEDYLEVKYLALGGIGT